MLESRTHLINGFIDGCINKSPVSPLLHPSAKARAGDPGFGALPSFVTSPRPYGLRSIISHLRCLDMRDPRGPVLMHILRGCDMEGFTTLSCCWQILRLRGSEPFMRWVLITGHCQSYLILVLQKLAGLKTQPDAFPTLPKRL